MSNGPEYINEDLDVVTYADDLANLGRPESVAVIGAGREGDEGYIVVNVPINRAEATRLVTVLTGLLRTEAEDVSMSEARLGEIERTWSQASQGTQRRWRVEGHGTYHKLYAVNDDTMHDLYLLDLSDGDTNFKANLDAIAQAPEHVATLLAEVRRLQQQVGRLEIALEDEQERNVSHQLEETTRNLRRANLYAAHLERELEKFGVPIRVADLIEAQEARRGDSPGRFMPSRPPGSPKPPATASAPDTAPSGTVVFGGKAQEAVEADADVLVELDQATNTARVRNQGSTNSALEEPALTFPSGASGGVVTTLSGESVAISDGVTPDVPASSIKITGGDDGNHCPSAWSWLTPSSERGTYGVWPGFSDDFWEASEYQLDLSGTGLEREVLEAVYDYLSWINGVDQNGNRGSLLMEMQPVDLTRRALAAELANNAGFVDYGISLRTAWPTEAGLAWMVDYGKCVPEHEDTERAVESASPAAPEPIIAETVLGRVRKVRDTWTARAAALRSRAASQPDQRTRYERAATYWSAAAEELARGFAFMRNGEPNDAGPLDAGPFVSVQSAIRLLNEALEQDRATVQVLFDSRVPTRSLVDHPTIQVGEHPRYPEFMTVGVLGLLNGIFGIRSDGQGHITGVFENAGIYNLLRFEETKR